MALLAASWLGHVTKGEIVVAVFVSVATLIVSTVVMIAVLVMLPADYFALEDRTPEEQKRRAAELPYRIGKNLVGGILVLAGIVMSVPGVPGQGVLTIVTGLLLLEFPGQRKIAKRILAREHVLHAINRIRRRFRKDPMTLDGAPPG